MEMFISILQFVACLLMVTLILLQPSKGGSFFTSSNQGVFGSSGGTTFLFRATMWCAGFLAASCIYLSWHRVHESGESVVPSDIVPAPLSPTKPATAPDAAAPAATGAAPATPGAAPATPAPAK